MQNETALWLIRRLQIVTSNVTFRFNNRFILALWSPLARQNNYNYPYNHGTILRKHKNFAKRIDSHWRAGTSRKLAEESIKVKKAGHGLSKKMKRKCFSKKHFADLFRFTNISQVQVSGIYTRLRFSWPKTNLTKLKYDDARAFQKKATLRTTLITRIYYHYRF